MEEARLRWGPGPRPRRGLHPCQVRAHAGSGGRAPRVRIWPGPGWPRPHVPPATQGLRWGAGPAEQGPC